MKIAFFVGSMVRGGAERVISILANYYYENNWQVDIIMLLDSGVGYRLDEGINLIDCTERGGTYYQRLPKWMFRVRKYVKSARPDRIVSFIGRINLLVLTACMGIDIPIIVSERNDPMHDGRRKLMRMLCGLSYMRADAIIFQTKYQQSCFSQRYTNKSYIIGNPISVEAGRELQRKMELVSVGRLSPQKNHEMLICAVKKLVNFYPDIHVKIFGEGELRSKLQTMITQFGVAKNVELCGSVTDVHKQMASATVFIQTSNYEGLSNALLEAMTLGLACISTNYPGVNEIITNGRNGIIVPCGDVNALCNCIQEIFQDEEYCKMLSENATESAKRFQKKCILKQWSDVINIDR